MKKPTKAPLVNDSLRQWTRGVSFTLAMGKTQVAALVMIALSQDRVGLVGLNHKLARNFVTAAQGLKDRGLVEHDRRFRVTAAGELVVGLLKLSGIYDELRVELVAATPSWCLDDRKAG